MYAFDKGPPPPLLKQAIRCKNWNTLPDGGGELDQEPGILDRMSAVLSAYETIRSRQRAKNVVSWIDADPHRYDHYMDLKYLVNHGVDAYLKMMAGRKGA